LTHVLIVEGDLALAERLSAALAPERVTVVASAKEAVEVIASGAVQIGIASSALFQDKRTLLYLRLIPWIVLTNSIDDELALYHNYPELNAGFLVKDENQRFLELLPLRARAITSRERLVTTIAKQFPGMVAYWDADERCQFANAAYKHWFGRGPRELLEMTLRELLGPIYSLNEPYIRGALRGEPQRFERSLPDPHGGPPRHTLATYTPDILDGRVRGFVAVVTDISEEYLLRQALLEREHRWATLFNILPVGVTVVDAQSAIVEMNPAIQEILKLDSKRLGQGEHKARRYIHTDGRPFPPSEFPSAKALATQLAVGPVEIGVIDDDHPTVWTSVSAAPFPNEDKVVIVTRDTTIEKANAARFEAMVEASPIPSAINDKHGNVTYVNRAFINTFGYTREDIPTLKDWWPKAYPDPTYRRWVITEWKTRYAKSKRENTPLEPMELTIRTKNGGERVAVLGGTVPLEGIFAGEHVVVLVDITERKKTEQQLEESRRLASLGALAGGIAHDFNNLLTPILAHVELALAELSSTSSLHRGLSEIQTAASHAAALVRQILAMSHPGDESKTSVAIVPLVDEVVRLLRASLPSNISIQVQIEPNSPVIFANSTRIHQVLLNLATNARDAMTTSGGKLTIAITRVDEKWVKVSVTDTGVGIEPDVLSRVFEPYFTTKFSSGGTGLGLATVRAIVTSLGGSITINSTPGKGTTVDVLFPALNEKDAVKCIAPAVQPLPPLTGQGQHILVVDDEPLVARAAARMLIRIGYRTTIVNNAADAIAAYDADTSIAAVLTDFTMPGMNGLDLARTLFELRPTRIILATGLAEHLTDENMKRAKVQQILLKPYGMAALGETMAAVLADKH
jgi:PAS domain S-box-containing protein